MPHSIFFASHLPLLTFSALHLLPLRFPGNDPYHLPFFIPSEVGFRVQFIYKR